MNVNENPYASSQGSLESTPSAEECRQFDEQLTAAKRITRRPAMGILVCSILSAVVVWCPLVSATVFGVRGLTTPWLAEHVVEYWYLYLIPFSIYQVVSFFGALSLLQCQNRLLAKSGAVSSLVPFVTPLFPVAMPFAWMGMSALRRPEVMNAFRRAELDERSNRTRALARLFGPASVVFFMAMMTILVLILPQFVFLLILTVEQPEKAAKYANILSESAGLRVAAVIVGSSFAIYSAIQMLRGRQYVVCVVRACLAIVPLLSPCVFLGFPFGVWALAILLQKDTRAAFAEGRQPPVRGSL